MFCCKNIFLLCFNSFIHDMPYINLPDYTILLANLCRKKSGVLFYDCYRLKGALIFEKRNRTRIHLILFLLLSVNTLIYG